MGTSFVAPGSGGPGGTATAVAVVLCFVVAGLAGSAVARASGVGSASPTTLGVLLRPAGSTNPIDHIVIVFQENHVYDQYYGTYCQNVGKYCDANGTGIPPATCVPYDPTNPAEGCVAPYLASNSLVTSPVDLVHDWAPAHQAYDNGSMDGFYLAEGAQLSTFAYYNGAQLPTYWDLAEQYGLGDNFYASVLSYSTPNHWYLVAGNAPNESLSQSFHRPVPNPPVLSTAMEQYLDQANDTATIADLLANSSVSWKYYDYALQTYSQAINAKIGAGSQGSAFDFWNPLAAVASSYTPAMSPHFVPSSSFFTDAASGNLPNVSWVLPTFNNSEHPPANLSKGEAWVASIINAVEASPEWNSSAIFITWDDYGGYYDHLPPPQVDANGVSFRTPLIVVSPYAREGYISHQFTYFESLLHLIEWRYHLPSLTERDANAPLPLDYFDFNASPRPPMHVPSPGAAYYPMPQQGLGQPRAPQTLTAVSGPASVTLNWSLSATGAGVTAYQLTYGPASDPTLVAAREPGSLSSLTVSNLDPSTTYEFSLTALTGTNASATVTTTAEPGSGTPSAGPNLPPTWTAIAGTGSAAPSARVGAGFVYDAADRADVLFGGIAPNGTYLSTTWEFTQGKWVKLNTSTAPPARAYMGMVYDSSDGVVLLFGGLGARATLGDTWKFSAGHWTNITGYVGRSAAVPSARSSPAISDNPSGKGVFLFGGLTSSGALGDTWRYSGGKWSLVALKTGPSARWGAAMAYDARDGYPLLTGGNSSTGAPINDTWKFSGRAWHLVTTSPSPGPRAGASLVFDTNVGALLLFGGANAGTRLDSTWSYAGGVWTALAPSTSPAARSGASMTYDGLHGGLLLAFGSTVTGDPSGLFEFGPPVSVSLTAAPSYGDAPLLVSFLPKVSGGMGPYRYTWTFGDGGTSTLPDATHAFALPGTYHVALTVHDAAGATVNASTFAVVGSAITVTAFQDPYTYGPIVNLTSIVGGGTPPYTYYWTFGDGTNASSSSPSPSHNYTVPGIFTATLLVTDADGVSATTSCLVTADGGTVAVRLSANESYDNGTLNVSLAASSLNGTGPWSYDWDFGDGTNVSGNSTATHDYDQPGSYVVTLYVDGPSGDWGVCYLVLTSAGDD